MTLDLPAEMLLAALLASVRAAAWLVIAPPFSSRAIPHPGQGAARPSPSACPCCRRPCTACRRWRSRRSSTAVVLQVASGQRWASSCYLIFIAVQAAGDLIDVFGGFSLAFAFDPLQQAGSSMFGRLYQWTALALLMASGGYLIVLQRLPAHLPHDRAGRRRWRRGRCCSTLATGVGQMMLSAVQIAAPLLAVLFLADVALGLLTRVAPALNAFAMGFPFKILLTLLLVGATFVSLPRRRRRAGAADRDRDHRRRRVGEHGVG